MSQRDTLTTGGSTLYEDLEHENVLGKGAKRTVSVPFKIRQTTIGDYDFVGMALPGTSETDSDWKIMRVNNTNDSIDFADGTSQFVHTWSAASLASISYL